MAIFFDKSDSCFLRRNGFSFQIFKQQINVFSLRINFASGLAGCHPLAAEFFLKLKINVCFHDLSISFGFNESQWLATNSFGKGTSHRL